MHGGEANLAKTLTAKLHAKTKMSLGPNLDAELDFIEAFELPSRYHRIVRGTANGKAIEMEYAITDGSGWLRSNGGPARDHKGEKLPIQSYWTTNLAMLPRYLGDEFTLEAGGEDKIDGKAAIGVKLKGKFGGEALAYFDAKTSLLVKCKNRAPHPLTGKEMDNELYFSEYKTVSGVQYPHRLTTFSAGKKMTEFRIERIELVEKIDDRLFQKP